MAFEAITTIYKTILSAFYNNYNSEIKKSIDPLI